jgi:putative FmdB family regulatory protein
MSSDTGGEVTRPGGQPLVLRGWHSYTPSAMPIYEYKCDNGHVFEVMQRMTDDPVASCQTCSAPVQRVFYPVAVHFKGSGFYTTDYGSKRQSRELTKAAEAGADKHDAEFKAKRDAKDAASSSPSDSSSPTADKKKS